MKRFAKPVLLAASLWLSVGVLLPAAVPSSAQKNISGLSSLRLARRSFVVTSGTSSYGANIWVTNTASGKRAYRKVSGAQNEIYCAIQLSSAASEVGLNPRLQGSVVEMDDHMAITVQGFVFKDV